MVARFNEIKGKVRDVNRLAEDETVGHERMRREIKRLTDEILEAL